MLSSMGLRTRSTLASLLCAILCAACGDDGGGDVIDASLPLADAAPGGADGGADAPAADAGPDAKPLGDILAELQAIPGVEVNEGGGPSGYRFFMISYTQPVDHHDPDGAKFTQQFSLLHHGYNDPVVLYTYGYDFDVTDSDRFQPTILLGNANQIAVEHRFFGVSTPHPTDWSKLDIWQAANDHHRIVQALKRLYGGKWLNTGFSKDGMTAVYHRRFFPDDVNGTVAYVAPLSLAGPDPRYIDFLDNVGDPACRQKLADYQRETLARRDQLVPLVTSLKDNHGHALSFSILGADVAFEHTILELPFGFWQYRGSVSCNGIPPTNATNATLLNYLNSVGLLYQISDPFVREFYGYYYQAGTQLGWPAVKESHLADLLAHPGTDQPTTYSPVPTTYDPTVMADIDGWVRTQGERLMFIYGGNDPWSAGEFRLGDAKDSFVYVVPGGNHNSNIANLEDPDKSAATATIRRWGGVGTAKRPATIAPGKIPPPRRLP